MPFVVSTVNQRLSATAYLYHDGIPGNALTYFKESKVYFKESK